MKILLLNTTDVYGGAGIATHRVYKELKKMGVDIDYKVMMKFSENKDISGKSGRIGYFLGGLRFIIDRIPSYLTFKGKKYSSNWFPTNISKMINNSDYDIVHLNWINGGFISIKDIGKIRKPLVWTLHDMWPFTGGLHYSQKNFNYSQDFVSRWIWKRKNKFWKNLKIIYVAPSNWIANCAKQSKLFRNAKSFVIPNGINKQEFYSEDKLLARKELNLPLNKKLVLFGADNVSDKRKGMHYLLRSLKFIKNNSAELITFGSGYLVETKNKVHSFGKINDINLLRKLYSAADVFVGPSLLEVFGQTFIESLACGTPIVAFDNSGPNDIIIHKKNGYLAKLKNVKDLAKGINWALDNGAELRENCILSSKKFEIEKVAKELKKVYMFAHKNNAGEKN